jgi:DNA-binding MarR family transcriptional regulator
VKTEIERLNIQDINNIQALILFNIAGDELTVGELTNRGYYLGSNVSYNVRKMVENDYLKQVRSEHDRRSVRVRLSEKGLELCEQMRGFFSKHANLMSESGAVSKDDLKLTSDSLRKLERFWGNVISYTPYDDE